MQELSTDFLKVKNTLIKAFSYFKSKEAMNVDEVSELYDFSDLIIKYPFGGLDSEAGFRKWTSNISDEKLNHHNIQSMDIESTGDKKYKAVLNVNYVENSKKSGEVVTSANYIYTMELNDYAGNEYMKINRQIVKEV